MILITEHEVKDPEGQIILDAIATRFGYTGFVTSQPTDEDGVPQTKQEFYQAWILRTTLENVASHLTNTAATVASKDKQDEIDTTIKPELKSIKKP